MPTVVEVTVRDPGDVANKIRPYEKRFRIEDEAEAWALYQSARKNGLEATAEKVRLNDHGKETHRDPLQKKR